MPAWQNQGDSDRLLEDTGTEVKHYMLGKGPDDVEIDQRYRDRTRPKQGKRSIALISTYSCPVVTYNGLDCRETPYVDASGCGYGSYSERSWIIRVSVLAHQQFDALLMEHGNRGMSMTDLFQQVVPEWKTPPIVVTAGNLLLAFALGCVSAVVYYLACSRGQRLTDRRFMTTLVLLSLLIALVTIVVGNNIALAFSLVGTLAIVRFRTVVEDTRDTAFVIYSVASGMAAGSGYLIAPLICAPLVFLTAWLLSPPVRTKQKRATLILRVATGQTVNELAMQRLKETFGHLHVSAVSTARGGSLTDISYHVHLVPPEQLLLLFSELIRIEGIQGVELKED